jgi:membrane protease subunit (stomatin/prohibitin family)
MGKIIDKLRAEFIDIVEWIDDSRHTLVWRFPRYHNQIKNGAQLIVRPGQTALFVCEGKLADSFGPGQHRLTTSNLPVLSTLAGWKYGFDSPFKAEVYFVATRTLTELKWGTPHPVLVRDPDFGPLRVRAFGTYALQAKDPRRLLEALVGTDSSFETEEIQEFLRSIVQSCFAEVLARAELSVLDLMRSASELAEQVRRAAAGHIDDEYGLEIPQLFIVNISVPPEVEQALDARSSAEVLGDLGRYQQLQLGRSLPIAAGAEGGGALSAGVGAGMGLALAGPFLQRAGGAGPTGPVPPAAIPSAQWYFAESGSSVGPLSLEQVAQAMAQGRITLDTLVWSPGMPGWTAARSVPALVGNAAPPPLPAR